jgi:hypothetical protein
VVPVVLYLRAYRHVVQARGLIVVYLTAGGIAAGLWLAGATTPWIEPGCLPSARPISLSDSPAFHRDHSSRFCPELNPGRPRCAIRPPPGRDPTIVGVASTDRTQGRGLQDLIGATQLADLAL